MYERFLESYAGDTRQPVDADIISKYSGIVPEQLIILWQEAGWGIFCDGMVRLVNPEEYQGFVNEYFHKDHNEAVTPFMVTAFGDIFACAVSRVLGNHIVFLNIRYGTFQILPNHPEVLLNTHLFDKRNYYALDRYTEIKEKIGVPRMDECFGYTPPLVLGGTEADENIQRVKLLPYIETIAQSIDGFQLEDFSGKHPQLAGNKSPKKKRFVQPTEEIINSTIIDIAREISRTDTDESDKEVMEAIYHCVGDILTYCKDHSEEYEDRCPHPEQENATTLKWLGMVDILQENGYARELDWKCELEDFIFSLQEITKKKKGYECLFETLKDGTFDEDEDITAWCSHLNETCQPHVIGCIDIDSDSYVIFPTRTTMLDNLKQAAEQIGQRIYLVENS